MQKLQVNLILVLHKKCITTRMLDVKQQAIELSHAFLSVNISIFKI